MTLGFFEPRPALETVLSLVAGSHLTTAGSRPRLCPQPRTGLTRKVLQMGRWRLSLLPGHLPRASGHSLGCAPHVCVVPHTHSCWGRGGTWQCLVPAFPLPCRGAISGSSPGPRLPTSPAPLALLPTVPSTVCPPAAGPDCPTRVLPPGTEPGKAIRTDPLTCGERPPCASHWGLWKCPEPCEVVWGTLALKGLYGIHSRRKKHNKRGTGTASSSFLTIGVVSFLQRRCLECHELGAVGVAGPEPPGDGLSWGPNTCNQGRLGSG